jgi:magnesium transporter
MIVDCAYYVDGARQQDVSLSIDDAGRQARQEIGFVWLALGDPTPQELEELQTSFDLPALAVEDAREGHQRPKLERYHDSDFLVVKTVRYETSTAQIEFGELAVFLGARYAIVTSRRSPSALEGARERLDDRPEIARLGSMAAAWALLDAVIDGYEPVIDRVADDLEATEQAVFQSLDRGQRIYLQRRQAAHLARALHPLLGPFESVERGALPNLPEQLRALFRDVGDHVRRLSEEAVMLGDALDALLNANLSGVTVRQNAVLQKVSGWAAIAAVPTIITGIYGMNFRHMPELGWRIGYPLALVFMVAVVYGLWRYFKRVGWL